MVDGESCFFSKSQLESEQSKILALFLRLFSMASELSRLHPELSSSLSGNQLLLSDSNSWKFLRVLCGWMMLPAHIVLTVERCGLGETLLDEQQGMTRRMNTCVVWKLHNQSKTKFWSFDNTHNNEWVAYCNYYWSRAFLAHNTLDSYVMSSNCHGAHSLDDFDMAIARICCLAGKGPWH